MVNIRAPSYHTTFCGK